MGMNNFAVFILTHGRPQNVKTYNTLRKQGYTGPIYIIIDNEDDMAAEYQRLYGDQVIVFDKRAVAQTFDEGDNFNNRRGVVYARNANFDIARRLGVEYFLQLDDDYHAFVWKFTSRLSYRERPIKNLDRFFAAVLEFYISIPAVTIALAQNGDFMGGAASTHATALRFKRKAMNTFFCSTERQFEFTGRINEDVNTYVTLGNRGLLFLTFNNAAIIQATTQQVAGGMTELYLDYGTYVKSFYTLMATPSCVKIGETGVTHRRLHHRINWDAAVPKILSEQYRKPLTISTSKRKHAQTRPTVKTDA